MTEIINKTSIGKLGSEFSISNGHVSLNNTKFASIPTGWADKLILQTTEDPGVFEFIDVPTGDITGSTGSTDNAILRADGEAGATIQSSLVTIDDNGSINIPSGQSFKINGTALAASDVGAATSSHNHSGTYQPADSELSLLAALSLSGNANKVIAVNTGADAFELVAQSGGSGDITTDTAWAAAGDLIVGSGNDTASILTKGTTGYYLKATESGLEWASVSASGGGSYVIQRSLEGVVYETSLMYWTAPVACTIDSVNMYLSSAPSAASSYCTVQVMKNGILETDSIFSSDAAMAITENTSAVNGIYPASGTLDTGNDMDDLAAGDVVHFRVNQADTGSADLLIQMMITVV